MNYNVALEIYQKRYATEMKEEQFFTLLEKGQNLHAANNSTDRLFINRYYKGDDLKAVNIALEYNELLMVRLLFQE